MDKNQVVSKTKELAKWWISERRKKLVNKLTDTMSVNPFIMPFLTDYHDKPSFASLAELVIASHLMTGHNTGFGKFIDEKILPCVFGTTKFSAAYRRATPPFSQPCFDEIDHILIRDEGRKELLSLKAGRWTIQLTMAVQLNAAFKEILDNHPDACDQIVVGVFYGTREHLTDKYDILRGINRGRKHDVIDLTHDVSVFAGREFWKWLSNGDEDAQEWVLAGIIKALREEDLRAQSKTLLDGFKNKVVELYSDVLNEAGEVDWMKLLRKING